MVNLCSPKIFVLLVGWIMIRRSLATTVMSLATPMVVLVAALLAGVMCRLIDRLWIVTTMLTRTANVTTSTSRHLATYSGETAAKNIWTTQSPSPTCRYLSVILDHPHTHAAAAAAAAPCHFHSPGGSTDVVVLFRESGASPWRVKMKRRVLLPIHV